MSYPCGINIKYFKFSRFPPYTSSARFYEKFKGNLSPEVNNLKLKQVHQSTRRKF